MLVLLISRFVFKKGEDDKLCSFTVENDLPGATKLKDEILHAVQCEFVSELRIGLESRVCIVFIHPCSCTMMNSFNHLGAKCLS